MIKNPTDINETNNHLSPQIIESPPPKKTTTYDLESKVLAWDMHKDVAGLNHLMGSQPKV
jgi:hypothetical protein